MSFIDMFLITLVFIFRYGQDQLTFVEKSTEADKYTGTTSPETEQMNTSQSVCQRGHLYNTVFNLTEIWFRLQTPLQAISNLTTSCRCNSISEYNWTF